jgi:hypothetical protein
MDDLSRTVRTFLDKLAQAAEAATAGTEEEEDKPQNQPANGADPNAKQKDMIGRSTPMYGQYSPKAFNPQDYIANRLDPNKPMPGIGAIQAADQQAGQNNQLFGKMVDQDLYANQDTKQLSLIGYDKMTKPEMDQNIMSGNGVGIAQNVDLVNQHRKGLSRWKDKTVSQFLNQNNLSNAGKADMERDDKRLI